MKFPEIKTSKPRTDSLTLEEYADFVEFFMKDADPKQVQRQKKHEENITKRFCLVYKE